MSEQGFVPLTSQLGISGTSYRLQLGLITNKWASRILKGNEVLDFYMFKDEEIDQDIPNSNYVVGWVLRTINLPNVNAYSIMKAVQALLKQAREKKDQKKVVAPVSETKEVQLQKVSEKELKRPKTAGWVKMEGQKSPEELEEEARKAFKERMTAKKEEELKVASGTVQTVETSRKLPSIPTALTKEENLIEKLGPDEKASVPAVKAEGSKYCPYCGGNLDFKFCPYCGKPLPHEH